VEVDRDAVVRTFVVESTEHLDLIEGILVALESAADPAEPVGRLFRIVHTLKGNAGLLEYEAVVEFAHRLEGVIERMRERQLAVSESLVSLLLEAVDALREMVPCAVAGEETLPPGAAAVLERLAALGGQGAQAPEEALAVKASSAEAPAVPRSARTLRVDLDKLDRLLTLAGELSIARGRLGQILEELPVSVRRQTVEAHHEADRLFADLQEIAMRVRMVPVGPTFRQFARLVRSLAKAAGKRVELSIEGEDVEVDTTLVEQLRDPLTHMIRNAIDHGIELPEARTAAGKDPTGQLKLRAYHEGSSVVVELHDDGAGFQRARIAEHAKAVGLAAHPEQLSDSQLLQLVFEPGFSTASEVTHLSGRGVGMDVVRRNIDALRGTIHIATQEGKGSTLKLRLPLTLASIAGFLVRVGEEVFVIPLDSVVECMELTANSVAVAEGRAVLNLRHQALPALRLREVFGVTTLAPRRESVVVVRSERGQSGLVVDALLGESHVVVKPLGKLFHGLSQFTGSAILGSGKVALILDIAGLFRPVFRDERTHIEHTQVKAEISSAMERGHT
jgi:two-component system chemotaxis sensor kinase CheA